MKRIIVFLLLCCILCIPAFAYSENSISDIRCGNNTIFVLMDDGKLIAWGDNSTGQIPSAESRGKISYDERCLITSKARSIALGSKCAFLIDSSNVLYGWGEDGDAALLCGSANGGSTTDPVKISEGVSFVSCGNDHNAAIMLDGTLCIWGMDKGGSLGLSLDDGSVIDTPHPVLKDVSTVCCHGNNTAAIAHGGKLYVWGEDFGFTAPHELASDICDVKRGGGNAFILKNVSNEVLLIRYGTAEDGTPSAELTAPIASNVAEITDYGYIRDDGTLWMCQSGDGNSFIPAIENVSMIDCYDMRYRVYLIRNILHAETYEYDSFKYGKTFKLSDVEVPVIPESFGPIFSIVLGVVLAAAVFAVSEKTPFYQRLRNEFIESFNDPFKEEQEEPAEQTQ